MIIKVENEDIFNTEVNHIAFAVNMEELNGKGNEQKFPLGTVISKRIGDKTDHALVCHSLKQGWGNHQAEVIKQCFDHIQSNDEPVATIAIGTGFISMLRDVDFRQIVVGMNESQKKIVLYSQYTMDEILDCIRAEQKKVAIKTTEKQLRKK